MWTGRTPVRRRARGCVSGEAAAAPAGHGVGAAHCHCQPTTQSVPDYVLDGLYASHLRRWLRHFPRDQLLVLTTRELDEAPAATLRRIGEFVGLPAYRYPPHVFQERLNTRSPEQTDRLERADPLARAALERLRQYYLTANRDLDDVVGHPTLL